MLISISTGIRYQISRRVGHQIRGEYGMKIKTRRIYKSLPNRLLHLVNGNRESQQNRCDSQQILRAFFLNPIV